jgi:hypothetical protein
LALRIVVRRVAEALVDCTTVASGTFRSSGRRSLV